jgi:hypothetical protein
MITYKRIFNVGHDDKIKQNIKAYLQNTATKIMQHNV